ncbi:N-acetyltransferase domain-containing protein [Mycena venus]|uniref:N-acetyltransferase domain-containing protein n=1 Tax=Mycena venus TaxID=2733690 RepID=A0A8H6Y9T9_9AGAR|nr:N-acetyltransferase domain-containing protein [Mycena venus]
MAEIVVRRLLNPTEDEIEQAAAVLNKAFLNPPDPFFHSLTGGKPRPRYFGPPRTYICAVAVWFGPGTDILETEEQRAVARWGEFVSKLTPEQKKWRSEYFIPRYYDAMASCIGEGTSIKSWHLDLLGTDPEHQRKGLSSALIRAVESKAKAEGTMMVLETTNDPNVAYYQKLGFVVRGAVSIVGSGGEITLTSLSKA